MDMIGLMKTVGHLVNPMFFKLNPTRLEIRPLERTVPKLQFQYIKMNPTFVKEKSGFFYATVVFNLAEDENIELTEVSCLIRAPRTRIF